MIETQVGEANEAFLTLNDVPIYFSEDWDTGIGGGLWSTGLAMARYFDQHADDVVNNLKRLGHDKHLLQPELPNCNDRNGDAITRRKGISAMELGAGNGFLSVCLLALTVHQTELLKELVVTDMADHLDLIATTLKANSHVWNNLIIIKPDDRNGRNKIEKTTNDGPATDNASVNEQKVTNTATVVVAEHLWGKFPSDRVSTDTESINSKNHDFNKKYDFIFGTDLAYRNSLHEPLISTLVQFSHEHTVCLIGVTMVDTQPVFFDLLTKAGFRYEKLADHLLGRDFRGSNFGIIVIQRR